MGSWQAARSAQLGAVNWDNVYRYLVDSHACSKKVAGRVFALLSASSARQRSSCTASEVSEVIERDAAERQCRAAQAWAVEIIIQDVCEEQGQDRVSLWKGKGILLQQSDRRQAT
jgi:hypothetical protein